MIMHPRTYRNLHRWAESVFVMFVSCRFYGSTFASRQSCSWLIITTDSDLWIDDGSAGRAMPPKTCCDAKAVVGQHSIVMSYRMT